jgi:excisionase family DNA binding protein
MKPHEAAARALLGVSARSATTEPRSTSDAPERRFTVNEVAALARCTPTTVRRAIEAGRLKATRRGEKGAWLIRQSDAEAWM